MLDLVVTLAAVYGRCPEVLDQILASVDSGSQESLTFVGSVLESLEDSPDELAWMCGYMADEINQSGDKPGNITNLSRKLIDAGLEPFQDFVPYPGRRILFLDEARFNNLSAALKREVTAHFATWGASAEELKVMNEALMKEHLV